MGEGAPVAGQIPELPLGPGRDERGPDHAPFGELGQPDGVEFVGLGPAGGVLDVAGVDHPALSDVVFQRWQKGACLGWLMYNASYQPRRGKKGYPEVPREIAVGILKSWCNVKAE